MSTLTPHFAILCPASGATLVEQLDDLWCQCRLLSHTLFHARIYLTDAANQWEQVRQSRLYGEYLSRAAVSFVEQPLLNGGKIALLLWMIEGEGLVPEHRDGYFVLRHPKGKLLFQTVRYAETEARSLTAEDQTGEAFRRHLCVLDAEGLNLKDHCLRTWIFVRDIDRHYAGVVKGRNDVFDREGLTTSTHFIASTGIGGYADNREAVVTMEFLSASGAGNVKYLQALDYLNPTAEYGVAFERGTALDFAGVRYRFISGTASIDKYGECLYRGDVMRQTERLFLNIDRLLSDDGATLADVRYFLVYLRDISDYQAVDSYLFQRFPAIPRLIVEARVCRPEWLIEVECIACC